MLRSDAFSYINVLDKAADASWLRQTTIANNIANNDTPTYKRKDVRFQDILKDELVRTKYSNLDQAVKSLDYNGTRLNGEIYTDADNFSYRIDKNNVDIDTENVELASEQLRYQSVSTAITGEFSRFKIVTGS
ncbi:flagellar basal-body rod protein FlgB [Lachnospiraceae bacterium C10]|jgi:flagellar basal-body rod protein FlgB|nr:flagellar basal body rod protein FlgB [Lachnospiraceae bacterium]SCW28560.1 flagellar basal-body rod protein FlgB [Lachnospiraceae bacterium C10]SDW00416.1 flagellar basal-body rod protein FlgB [Lachnospiraceae bacterium KHCPX20]